MDSTRRNTFYFTAAFIVQKIISFVYFTFIARMLGPEDTGKYIFAITFTTLFSVFADLGISPAINRDVARSNANAQRALSSGLFIKIFLLLLSYFLVIAGIFAMGIKGEVRLLILISGITMMLDSIHLTLYSIFRGLRDLRFESFGIMMSQFITLIIGASALFLRLPIYFLILAFTFSSFLNCVYSAVLLYLRHKILPIPKPDFGVISSIIKVAGAFGIAGIFSRMFSSLDSLILSRLAGGTALGIYSVPNKISFAFQFIPMSLVAAIFPALSASFVTQRAEIKNIFFNSFRYLSIFSFAICFGVISIAENIINDIYGSNYIASVLPLKILMVTLIFAFLSFPIGSVLNACNRQYIQTTLMGISVIINIISNFILIPRYGVLGASFSALISYFFLSVSGLIASFDIINTKIVDLLSVLLKCLISSIIMFIAVIYLKSLVPWFLTIPLGVVCFAVLSILLKLTSLEEIKMIFKIKNFNYA